MAGFDTAQVISILIGVVLPLIVGYVTKESWSSGVKAITLLALSAFSGFMTELYDAIVANVIFDWRAALLGAIATFLTGVGMHFGFFKATGMSAAVQQRGVKD